MESLTSNEVISSLWSPSSVEKCRIGLSDLIMYEQSQPTRWFVTGSEGDVRCKRSVDLPVIARRWRTIAEKAEAPYIAIVRQDGCLSKFLSIEAWERFISDKKLEGSIESVHCFFGSADSMMIYRNNYLLNVKTGRWKNNTFTYSVPLEYPMHVQNSEKVHLTESKAQQICRVLDLATTTVLRYVEKMLKITIVECSIDYIIDRRSQIWMLWSNKTRFTRPLKPSSAALRTSIDFNDSWISQATSQQQQEEEDTAKQLTAHIHEATKRRVTKKDPSTQKPKETQFMHVFSTANTDGAPGLPLTKAQTFPTPYRCQGDYCHMLVQAQPELRDERDATQQLFSEEEIRSLQRDPIFTKMIQFGLSGNELVEISARSIELARQERRGLEEARALSASQTSTSWYDKLVERQHSAADNKTNAEQKHYMRSVEARQSNPQQLDGFPQRLNSFYDVARVCGVCYDVYRCLDWARQLLQPLPSSSSPTRRAVTDSSTLSLPKIRTTDESPGRSESREKEKKPGKLTWKKHVAGTDSQPPQRNELVLLDNYVRGKSNNYPSLTHSAQATHKTDSRGNKATSKNLRRSQAKSSSSSVQNQSQSQVTDNLHRGHVLLLCSDADDRQRLEQILSEAFFQVTTALDGREALQLVVDDWRRFDCALLDRDAALLSIFDLVKAIRNHEKELRGSISLQQQGSQTQNGLLHHRLPLLCYTNQTTPSDLTKYMKADMDGCISQPADASSLLATVRAAVPHHLAPLPARTKLKPATPVRVSKIGLLGELEDSKDSASMALKTLPLSKMEEGSESHGFVQLDADTRIPFLVLNGVKYSKLRNSLPLHSQHVKEKFFNLVICHDLFDTFERMKILLQPIVQRYQAIQILVWNYPGQGQTEWRKNQLLNNEYLATCLNELLGQVGEYGTRDFQTQEPFYVLGLGYGANIAAYFLAHFRAPNVRGLLAANAWAFVDSYLAGVMHDCVNIFQSAPASRPDLPVYFFSRFLFSKDYLAKVSVPLALNIYTAVYNSITNEGRVQLCKGVLQSVDLRPLLASVDCPIICLHSQQNNFIRPLHVEPFVSCRSGEVHSIHKALQDYHKTCVIWMQGGHELFQEQRKHSLLLLEQVLTGYHEVHELTFPSASAAYLHQQMSKSQQQSTTSIDQPSESLEEKFTKSVLSLSRSTVSPLANQSSTQLRPSSRPSLSRGSSPNKSVTVVSPSAEPGLDWQHYSNTILQRNERHDQGPDLTSNQNSTYRPNNSSNNKSNNGNKQTQQRSAVQKPSDAEVHQYPEVQEYMQWRLKRNKKRLQRLQFAAKTIQSAFRAYLARNIVRRIRQQRAAVNIQRLFRGHLGRQRFYQHIRRLWASINIQRLCRGHHARVRVFLLKMNIAAAANIQRVFRGHRARLRVKAIRKRLNHAASVIQAMFRRYQARRDAWLRRHFRNNATFLQRIFRGYIGRRRAQAERDKYIFSKSQSQGIEFGRQMLLEHKLHVTRLQSDVTLLTQEKVSAEEQIEALLEEISSFEEGVRTLEKEMHQLSRVESEASAFMDEDSKFELREQKMRLDREFGEMLSKISNRKDMLCDLEKKLATIDKTRQGKEEDLRTLERKLVVLLEDQQKELSAIRRKQDIRGAMLAASHSELAKVTAAGSVMSKSGTAAEGSSNPSRSLVVTGSGSGGGFTGSGPSLQEKKQAAQLMQSTETLMKFGFMSMSMTYFSSLNMIKALRTVAAQDTVMAALADVHTQRAMNPSASLPPTMDEPANADLRSRYAAPLRRGELPGQQRLQVSSWSVDDVAKWLQTLSLGQYTEAFIDSAIDGEFLYDLNDDDLKNTLGVDHRLHRKKILNCVARLKAAEAKVDGRFGRPVASQPVSEAQGQMQGVPSNVQGDNSSAAPSFQGVGFPDDGGGVEDDRHINGPKLTLAELISLVRHSKLAQLKEAIDYLPNRAFDKTLVQAAYIPDHGTVYIAGYDRLPFHINKTDDYGNTLLCYASQNGNIKIAKYLVVKGANPNHQNKQGQTPAHFAIAYKFFDLSTWIFENGGDDTIENKFGLTAYDGLSGAGDELPEGAMAIEE